MSLVNRDKFTASYSPGKMTAWSLLYQLPKAMFKLSCCWNVVSTGKSFTQTGKSEHRFLHLHKLKKKVKVKFQILRAI